MEKTSRRNFIQRNALGLGAIYLEGFSSPLTEAQTQLEHKAVADVGKDLSEFIPRLMRHVGVPGLSISVISEGKIIWRQGFGVTNIETNEPVTIETPFEAASFSKAAFAYVVVKLCQQGKLSL